MYKNFTFTRKYVKIRFMIKKDQSKNRAFATYIVLVMAVLLSKVLGLVRNMLLSNAYGTSIEASAFTAVSNFPLIIFDVTLGTAISSAFIPVFNEKLALGKDRREANKFASNFITIVVLFTFVIVALGLLFPRAAVWIVARGFEGEILELSIKLMRIIIPIVSFACVTFISIGILQSYNEFIAPALVSTFSNLAMIIYFLLFNSKFGIYGLAASFLIGWIFQFLFLIPFLKKKKFKYSFTIDFKSPDIKKVIILTLPLFVASLAQPINQLISSNVSSTVAGTAGVSTVNYAYNAYFIVAGVFSYALTNMFFPEMSRRFANKDNEGACSICSDMLGTISTIILPVMAFMAANAHSIIKLLYERGEFTASDTNNVAALLMIYTLGMLLLSWQDILCKLFYSMQKSVIPMIAAVAGIAVNLIIALVLTNFIGLSGLAVSTVISAFIMTLVLLLFCRKYAKSILNKSLLIELVKDVLSALAMLIVCAVINRLLYNALPGIVGLLGTVVISFAAGAIIYLFLLFIMRSKQLGELIKIFRRRGVDDNL